jgi:copper(I)-binding protein
MRRASMRLLGRLALLLAVGGGGIAAAQSPPSDGSAVQVSQAWARRAPMLGQTSSSHGHAAATHGAGNGAVYVLIENRGTEPDALLAATSDAAATAELHETRLEGGVMRMHPLPRVDLPPGGRIEMKPGGYHIMLLGLTRDLHAGDTVAVRLRFEKAGERMIEAPVR